MISFQRASSLVAAFFTLMVLSYVLSLFWANHGFLSFNFTYVVFSGQFLFYVFVGNWRVFRGIYRQKGTWEFTKTILIVLAIGVCWLPFTLIMVPYSYFRKPPVVQALEFDWKQEGF